MRHHPIRRSRWTAVVLLLAASGLATSCSDSSDAGGDPAGPEGTELMPAAEGNVEYPLTLDTAWGEVTIEERPERVVAASQAEYSLLASLGVVPVAVGDLKWADGGAPWATELVDPDLIEYTWESGDLEVLHEPVAAATPDLIVATSAGESPYPNLDQLSAIAPVVAKPDDGKYWAVWTERLEIVAEALDLTERADQVVKEYETFFEELRAEYPEFEGKTAAAIGHWGGKVGTYYLSAPGEGWRQLLLEMGFEENPYDERFNANDAVSEELLNEVSADVVIAVDLSGEPERFQEWVDSPIFQSIDGVEAGNLLTVDNSDYKTLIKDGEKVAVIGHFGLAVDDPTGTPRFANAFAPLLGDVLAN